MTIEEFYVIENSVKTVGESCFADTEGLVYDGSEITSDEIFSKDELIAFAEAWHHHCVEQSEVSLNFESYENCNCGSSSESPHTCPFLEEIHDNQRLCTCCNTCTYECAQDI